MQDSDVILKRLMSLHPKKIDLTLGRIEGLLEKLGRPQDRLPPVIHIAGTNGKGSTLAFLKAMFEADGQSVHRYTSPHLVRFSERIQLNGRDIDETLLASLLDRVEQINDGAPITFFEVTTAAALLAFSEHPADVVLLETGLGGRLDATNVLSEPALTVITPISMDHQDWLGSTLTEIANEKAGIIKPGVTLICAQQQPEVEVVLRDRCSHFDAPLKQIGDLSSKTDEIFHVEVRSDSDDWRIQLPEPSLQGHWQKANAALAALAAHHMGLPAQAIEKGVLTASWPGRMQLLSPRKSLAPLSDQCDIWYDGGHNAAAANAISTFWRRFDQEGSALVIGLIDTKNYQQFVNEISILFPFVVAIPVNGSEASISPDTIVRFGEQSGRHFFSATDISGALTLIGENRPSVRQILITGSLYHGAEVLPLLTETGPTEIMSDA